MKYNFDRHSPYHKVVENEPLKGNEREINGRIVRLYPDNNGGLWYWHPETGREVRIP
jgi:hypothetical protein